jgi:hypothetical protein
MTPKPTSTRSRTFSNRDRPRPPRRAAPGAVHAGYRVYYTTAADLVARTAKAALDGRWQTTMPFWNGPQLLVVDELGYLPMPGEAASHLFQVISRRYEHGSIILTTNRGIASWGEIWVSSPFGGESGVRPGGCPALSVTRAGSVGRVKRPWKWLRRRGGPGAAEGRGLGA